MSRFLSWIFIFAGIGIAKGQTADTVRLLPECYEDGYILNLDSLESCGVVARTIKSATIYGAVIRVVNGRKTESENINKLGFPIWGVRQGAWYFRAIVPPENESGSGNMILAPVCKVGAISLYGHMYCTKVVTARANGEMRWVYSYTPEERLYMSHGLDGQILIANFKNLQELVKDEPDLVDAIHDMKLSGLTFKMYPQTEDTFRKFMGIVDEYNSRHMNDE